MNNLITPQVLDKLKSTSYPFTLAPEHYEPSEVFEFAGTHYLIPSVHEVKTYLGGASINIELSLEESQWSFTIFFGTNNSVYNSIFRHSDYIDALNVALETALDIAFEYCEYYKALHTPVVPERIKEHESELITQEALQMLLNHNYPFTKVPDNWEPKSETFIHDDVRYLIPNVHEVSMWLERHGVHIELAKTTIETALKKIAGKVLSEKKYKERYKNIENSEWTHYHNKSAMPTDSSTDDNFRRQAALAIMCALLETTKHDVILEPVLKKTYAKAAIDYAEELIAELGKETH